MQGIVLSHVEYIIHLINYVWGEETKGINC